MQNAYLNNNCAFVRQLFKSDICVIVFHIFDNCEALLGTNFYPEGSCL